MNLRALSNIELDLSFKLYVQKEREILKDILLHVAEADRRRLYLDFGKPNLFEYMTAELKYTNGSAQRRIDAARLYQEVPEILETLESGELNMTSVEFLQRAVRQVWSDTQTNVSTETKKAIVNELVGKSVDESQVIIAQALNIQIKEKPRIRHQADESVRFEVTLSKEQWEKLKEMQALVSHAVAANSWDKTLEYVADKVIAQKKKVLQRNRQSKTSISSKAQQIKKINDDGNMITIQSNNTYKKEAPSEGKRAQIPAAILRRLYQTQNCCQFVSKLNNKQCGSKWFLQPDHIKPIWAGGDNSIGNLQLLCAGHNQDRYRKQAGIQRV